MQPSLKSVKHNPSLEGTQNNVLATVWGTFIITTGSMLNINEGRLKVLLGHLDDGDTLTILLKCTQKM